MSFDRLCAYYNEYRVKKKKISQKDVNTIFFLFFKSRIRMRIKHNIIIIR